MKWGVLVWAMLLAAEFANGGLPERQIRVGGKALVVEIADTDEARTQGLMFRKALAEGRGMLFVFPEERTLSFWMKNTFIPLSIGFFDRTGRLINVLDMEPTPSMAVADDQLPRYASQRPALYALEVPRGWFRRNGIRAGQRLDLRDQKLSELPRSEMSPPRQ